MLRLPSSWLTSTMRWRPPADDPDGLGGEYGPEKVTERVRFQRSRPRASGGNARSYERSEGPEGTVIIDAVKSVGEVPPLNSIVNVDGMGECTVTKVTPYYVRGELFTTELEVR